MGRGEFELREGQPPTGQLREAMLAQTGKLGQQVVQSAAPVPSVRVASRSGPAPPPPAIEGRMAGPRIPRTRMIRARGIQSVSLRRWMAHHIEWRKGFASLIGRVQSSGSHGQRQQGAGRAPSSWIEWARSKFME